MMAILSHSPLRASCPILPASVSRFRNSWNSCVGSLLITMPFLFAFPGITSFSTEGGAACDFSPLSRKSTAELRGVGIQSNILAMLRLGCRSQWGVLHSQENWASHIVSLAFVCVFVFPLALFRSAAPFHSLRC